MERHAGWGPRLRPMSSLSPGAHSLLLLYCFLTPLCIFIIKTVKHTTDIQILVPAEIVNLLKYGYNWEHTHLYVCLNCLFIFIEKPGPGKASDEKKRPRQFYFGRNASRGLKSCSRRFWESRLRSAKSWPGNVGGDRTGRRGPPGARCLSRTVLCRASGSCFPAVFSFRNIIKFHFLT